MTKSLLILGIALVAIGCGARTLCAQAWCRIHVTSATGEQFAGSGSVISVSGQTAAILTAAHVVDGSIGGRVELPTGATGQITQTFIDKTGVDLALVIVECRGPLPPPITLGEWQEGQLAAWHGYGSGQYATSAGPSAIGVGVPAGWPQRDATIATPCRSGDSGGPVVDEAGRLIGVVWGCETTTQSDGSQLATATHFAPITPLRDFLRRCFGQQPWRAGSSPTPDPFASVAPPNCPSGLCPLTDPNGWRSVSPPNQPTTPMLPPPVETPAPSSPPSMPPIVFPEAPNTDVAPPSGGNRFLELFAAAAPAAATLLLDPLGGAGAGALVAQMIARRAIRRIASHRASRNQQRASTAATRTEHYDSPAIIPVDTPPRTIHAKTETHFVPVDDPKFDRAYSWAVEQLKRKYPGGSDLLEPLDSLIKQHLNAQTQKTS